MRRCLAADPEASRVRCLCTAELLGVDDIASPAEIKAAYRALQKVCHVDVSGDNEPNRNICILLNEAYEVLMDPESRTAYNAELDAALAVSGVLADMGIGPKALFPQQATPASTA